LPTLARAQVHGAWSDLKTANARRSIPLPAAVRAELKARYAALNGNVVRLGPDDRTVFTSPEGSPLGYQNFHGRDGHRSWSVQGSPATPHMLRHSYATALIQAAENVKTVQTLMGHYSVAFTMGRYADAWRSRNRQLILERNALGIAPQRLLKFAEQLRHTSFGMTRHTVTLVQALRCLRTPRSRRSSGDVRELQCWPPAAPSGILH
jgi:hypothetical protein